ncbi:hypothetical protein F2Q68_00004178 [Brassica cretica]|uniref:Secreted protein n=2 Tax=Brassica cretica TaxID=69181 RepID=A0ABQ7CCG5_BRACR|nr:hypothetical protein F2Q68_00004178 [Brassica cretica]KAF3549331.1 hypothetical protein DY000_02006120 [Brassica cretica]
MVLCFWALVDPLADYRRVHVEGLRGSVSNSFETSTRNGRNLPGSGSRSSPMLSPSQRRHPVSCEGILLLPLHSVKAMLRR